MSAFYYLHLAFFSNHWSSMSQQSAALTVCYQYFIRMQKNMLMRNYLFFFFSKGGAINVSILWALLHPRGSFEPSNIKAIRLFLYSFIHGFHPLYDFPSFFPFMLKQIRDGDVIPEVDIALKPACRDHVPFQPNLLPFLRQKEMIFSSLSLFLLSPPAWFNYLYVNVNYFGALPLKNGIITVESCFL